MKQKNILIMSALVVLGLSSCKKELDKQPTDSFSDANAFLTLADVQLGTNGAYERYSAYLNDIYTNALTSDEAKIGSGSGGQGVITYHFQYSSDATSGGDVTAAWGQYYSMIDQINRVLPFVATVSATPAQEPRRNILKAQLLALRAIAHFSLLETYSKNYNPSDPLGVPALTVSNPLAYPARNSMGEVMTLIESDLSTAKSLLPAVTVSTFSDTVMNKVNIAAYQARIALYKGDYTAAAGFATEVISSGVKLLAKANDFKGIWTDNNSFETLFRIRFATSTALGALWTTTGGQIYISPSDKLVASFDASDIRFGTYIGNSSSGYYVNKYLGSSRGGRVVDMKCCRISEMYLIRAEAYAKQTSPDLVHGTADLDSLRAARIDSYIPETFATAADLINAVQEERFKELCFEGFRFFDLKRNNLPVARLLSDANPAWQNLPVGSNLFVYPIPAAEILANKNIVQNSGY